MLIGANLRSALRSLVRTPVRSFLVLQGIAWGVGIAIFPAAVLEGSRRAAVERADEVGTGRVTVVAEPGSRGLDLEDLAAVRRGVPGFRPFEAAPARVEKVKGGGLHLLGTDAAGAGVRYQRVLAG